MRIFKIILFFLLNISILSALEEKPGQVNINSYYFKKSSNEFDIILNLNIEKGWHIYWKNPGDAGIPTNFNFDLPTGIKLNAENWEIPDVFPYEDYGSIGYKDNAKFRFSFTSDYQLNSDMKIKFYMSWLICKEGCYTGFDTVDVPLTNSNTIDAGMSYFAANEGNYAIDEPSLNCIANIKNDYLNLKIENLLSINENIKSITFLPENTGFLSTTEQNFSIENNSVALKIMLDELREQNPEKLEGIIIIEDNDKNKIAYRISFTIN